MTKKWRLAGIGAHVAPLLRSGPFIAAAGIGCLLIVLAVSLKELIHSKPESLTLGTHAAEGDPPFSGTLELRGLDLQTKSGFRQVLNAELVVQITARVPEPEDVPATVPNSRFRTNDIVLSLGEDQSNSSREIMHFAPGAPGFVRRERNELDFVDLRQQISLELAARRPPLLYPFDAYRFHFHPQLCVNREGEPCPKPPNVWIRQALITYSPVGAEGALQIRQVKTSDGGVDLEIRRLTFLRLMALLLFGMALVFFWFLVSRFPREDLFKGALGYFGALWGLRGLLVPKTITIFPTAVDYAIVTIFGSLFIAVLAKYLASEERGKT